MSSLSRYWRLLDSSSLSKPDYYYFTQQFLLENRQGTFAIISEAFPLLSENKSRASRSDIGASLATEAAELAFAELQDKKLDFVEMFFSLFSKHWKATVLFHAIENPIVNNIAFSSNELSDALQIAPTQKDILEHYDSSIAVLYQFDQQLVLLQLGDAQIALLNQRYHCEIKKASQQSLANFLLKLENNIKPELQFIDIKPNQIEMIVLLSKQYTTPKTMARLKTNMIRLYRQLDSEKKLNHITDNLIILKKEVEDVSSPSIQDSVDIIEPKVSLKTKKKSTSLAFFLFILVSGTVASYYFWQVQATEKKLAYSKIEQQIDYDKISEESLSKLSISQEKFQVDIEAIQMIVEKEKQQAMITKTKEDALKRKKEEQQKVENQARIEANKKLVAGLKKQQEQLHAEKEAEKQRLFEADKLNAKKKEQELREQEAEKIRKEAEAQKESLKKKEEAYLLSIERDIELIAWHNNRVRDEKIAAQQVRRKQYAIKKQQEQIKREQEVKIAIKKQEEKQRLEALVRQRRAEFERNNKQQKQQAIKVNETKTVIPENRQQQQRKTHQYIKKQADEKSRKMQAELKKQQYEQLQAKDARQRLKQKTAIHQLVAYSKTFNRHTQRLKKKLDAISRLNQRPDAFSNPAIVRERALLKGKEATIRKRLDSLAKLYSGKLKRLCSKPKVYSVKASPSNTVEGMARSIIAQQLRSCSQTQLISSKGVSRALLNRYLK